MGLPDSATSQGEEVIQLWQVFFVLAVLVAALIWALTAYVILSSIRRRRAHAGADEAGRASGDAIPRQRQYNTRLELVYTAIPLLLVFVLLGLSVSSGESLTARTDTPAVDIRVVGFQWQWQFEYLGTDGRPTIVLAGDPETPATLMLPVGRKVRFTLHATDVIHSFWVPEFLEKRDLVPGFDNVIEVDVTAAGEWTGRCAEYCGFNHWLMVFKVKAVPADEYDRWAADSAARPQPIVAGGRQITSTTSSTAVPITTAPPVVTNPPISTRGGSATTAGAPR